VTGFVDITPGRGRLILSIPHAGTEIPVGLQPGYRSLWLARKDADWWLPALYEFAGGLGATIVSTRTGGRHRRHLAAAIRRRARRTGD
jgi:N-formylglutamate deformylase